MLFLLGFSSEGSEFRLDPLNLLARRLWTPF